MPNPRELEPIGENRLKLRGLHGDAVKSKYIFPDTWSDIIKWFTVNDPEVIPNIKLMKLLGLRCSESQGLYDKRKFFKDYVLIAEQGFQCTDGKMTYKPLKGLYNRKVRYWYTTAKEAWALAEQVVPMHPDTLNERINIGLQKFGHLSHDIRRTFITDSRRKHEEKDVMLAVGHKSPVTNRKYDQDDRAFEETLADI